MRSSIELRNQNIQIVEKRGRPELQDEQRAGKRIILTESNKTMLRRLFGRFAKKIPKKGGDQRQSISNNREMGREVAARINQEVNDETKR